MKILCIIAYVVLWVHSCFSQCEGSYVSHHKDQVCMPDTCYQAIADNYESLIYKSDQCDSLQKTSKALIDSLKHQCALKDTVADIIKAQRDYATDEWQKQTWARDEAETKLDNQKTWTKAWKTISAGTTAVAVSLIVLIKITH